MAENKEEAQYHGATENEEHCSGCKHFCDPQQCEIVEGWISPNGWCKYYTGMKK